MNLQNLKQQNMEKFEKIEKMIAEALVDGELTEREKQTLFKKAIDEGIDLEEFEKWYKIFSVKQ
jgi:hypothetical protein